MIIRNYALDHPEFERMTCTCDFTTVDCFFDPYTDNLHFAYIGGQLVTEMLRDSVIQNFERQYTKACQQEAEDSALDLAISNYELKKGYA
jgi:hypothetical protein